MSSWIRFKAAIRFALLLGCAALAGCSDTAEPWQARGPYGGTVLALAVDRTEPRVVYAGTRDGGVFRSENGGRTWVSASAGLHSTTVNDIALDPASSVVYAGAERLGILSSHDHGRTWQTRNTGLDSETVRALLVLPDRPGELFAGTFGNGLFHSEDGGDTWRRENGAPEDAAVYALAAGQSRPETVFAGTDAGIYRLRPGSTDWELTGDDFLSVEDIVSTPNGGVFAAAFGDGVMSIVGDDDGWATVGEESADLWVTRVAHVGDRVYAGGASSGVSGLGEDGMWRAAPSLPDGRITALASGSAATLYAGVEFAGLHVLTDGADEWLPSTDGLSAVSITSFAVGDASHSVLYAGSQHGGAYRSFDRGHTWEPMGDLPDPDVTALAVHPRRPSTVYIALRDGSLWKSSDHGERFMRTSVPAGPDRIAINALVIHGPSDTVFAGLPSGEVFRSDDSGASWVLVTEFTGLNSLTFDKANPDFLYAGTECGLYRNIYPSAQWTRQDDNANCRDVVAAATHRQVPGLIYMVTRERLFQSLDGGRNWRTRDRDLVDNRPSAVVIDPGDSWRVYVGTESGHIFVSENRGASWQSIGLDANLASVTSLVVDPHRARTVLAATAGNSIVSQSWTRGIPMIGILLILLAVVLLAAYWTGPINRRAV